MANIYLALYKGRGGDWWDKLTDWAIRTFTGGKYSHCEIAIERLHFESGDRCRPTISYDCYTSSPRDGGVRCKKIDVSHRLNWDLVLLPAHIVTEEQILAFYTQTQGKKYDYLGALGVLLGNPQNPHRWFCSEWCATLLGLPNQHKVGPNQLLKTMSKREGKMR